MMEQQVPAQTENCNWKVLGAIIGSLVGLLFLGVCLVAPYCESVMKALGGVVIGPILGMILGVTLGKLFQVVSRKFNISGIFGKVIVGIIVTMSVWVVVGNFSGFTTGEICLSDCSLSLTCHGEIPKTWLIKEVNIEQVEAEQRVNEIHWKMLKTNVMFFDELWEFRSPPETWTNLAGREGYAVVRFWKPIDCVVTGMN